jgi:trehalose synthase
MVVSEPDFARDVDVEQFLVAPSIDPLSDKNRELEPDFVHDITLKYGLDPSRPIVTQVSRFDRLKDPIGVIEAYQQARRYNDCQLLLVGGGATDDPEGHQVLTECREKAAGDKDIHVLELPPDAHLEINALQRASTVIVQKSLREGFGLTGHEALWKAKPVIATATGRHPAAGHAQILRHPHALDRRDRVLDEAAAECAPTTRAGSGGTAASTSGTTSCSSDSSATTCCCRSRSTTPARR